MSHITVKPCEELVDFVKHFWFAEWDEPSQHMKSTYFATANSLSEIAFAYRGDKRHPELLFSSVQGQTCAYGQYPASGFFELFGVSLYSHAIPFLFNIPASTLNNEVIGLETLLGKEGKYLIEKMAGAVILSERIRILTNYFKSKLANTRFNDKLMVNAAKRIRQCHGDISIEKLSQEFCYSHKQFNRRFKEYSGFNPKLFTRIVRFESVLENHHRCNSLTDAALMYGYYDQSHFIRDFRNFSGFSPNRFFGISGH